MDEPSPERRLDAFIDRYTPEVAALARAVLAGVRARLPGATELVYDGYNALAVAFGASERAADGILSVTLYPRWVSLFFVRGAELPDPEGRLRGTGSTIRHLVLHDAAALADPAVEALIAEAVRRAPRPLDGTGPGRVVVRSVSAKQRPRRPA